MVHAHVFVRLLTTTAPLYPTLDSLGGAADAGSCKHGAHSHGASSHAFISLTTNDEVLEYNWSLKSLDPSSNNCCYSW